MSYIAIVLDERSRRILAEQFPARNTRVLYHHVTLSVQTSPAEQMRFAHVMGKTVPIKVIGHKSTQDLQACVVQLPLGLICRNSIPHITLTCDVPPMQANEILALGYDKLDDPILLMGTVLLID